MARDYVKAPEILCWDCRKAVGGCSWSDKGEPVSGWEAAPSVHADGKIYGYNITACPEFEHDGPEDRTQLSNKEGVMQMMEALVRQMRDDYIRGYGPITEKTLPIPDGKALSLEDYAKIRRANRKYIEDFLKCPKGRTMLQLTDPDAVIEQLRYLAKRHDAELFEKMTDAYV